MERHFFDGDPDAESCRDCGQPYETADERHDYGKLINPETRVIRPYTLADYENERELSVQEVLAMCNGNYPDFGQLSDKLVDVWNQHAPRIPVLWPGITSLVTLARERKWLHSCEKHVIVDASPGRTDFPACAG
jgi:hypothetical protein